MSSPQPPAPPADTLAPPRQVTVDNTARATYATPVVTVTAPTPTLLGNFTWLEIGSAVGALIATLILVYVAWRSYYAQSLFFLAASMGALGGIGHEFAQSGGRIVFIQRRGDGLYLGSLTGAVLGAVAGLLMIRGYLTPGIPAIPYGQVAYETFTSGLALKGVVEALTDKPAPVAGTPPTDEGGGDEPGGGDEHNGQTG